MARIPVRPPTEDCSSAGRRPPWPVGSGSAHCPERQRPVGEIRTRSPSLITGMSFLPCSSGPMINSMRCRSPSGLGLKWMPSARGWTCRPTVKSLLRQASRSSRQEAMNPGVKRRRRLACIREGLADGQPADDNGRRRTQASDPDQGKGALRQRRRSEFAGAAAKCRWNSRQMCQDIAMLVERSQAVFSSDHVDP